VDLPDVVEDAGESETIEVVVAQTEPMAQVDREVGDPVHMPVQILYHILHHLDEEVVRKHLYSHTDSVSLVMTRQVVDKSFGSFLSEPLLTLPVNAAIAVWDTGGTMTPWTPPVISSRSSSV
jgi:hypothetical protein